MGMLFSVQGEPPNTELYTLSLQTFTFHLSLGFNGRLLHKTELLSPFLKKVLLQHYLLNLLVPFMLLYIVHFFCNSVSFENRHSLHFSTVRLRVFPLFTLAAKKLRDKSEASPE